MTSQTTQLPCTYFGIAFLLFLLYLNNSPVLSSMLRFSVPKECISPDNACPLRYIWKCVFCNLSTVRWGDRVMGHGRHNKLCDSRESIELLTADDERHVVIGLNRFPPIRVTSLVRAIEPVLAFFKLTAGHLRVCQFSAHDYANSKLALRIATAELPCRSSLSALPWDFLLFS